MLHKIINKLQVLSLKYRNLNEIYIRIVIKIQTIRPFIYSALIEFICNKLKLLNILRL